MLIVLLLIAFFFSFNINTKNRSLNNEIADRKQAEKMLGESEEKYRLIFDHTPVGLLSFDKNGVIIACNDKFVQIIGSSREALIGLNMLTLPDKKIVSSVREALKGKDGLYEDVYQSVTSKKITPVRALFAPMDDGGGHVRGGVGIIEDITDRKQAEAALTLGKERARFQRNAIARIVENEVMSIGDLPGSFERLTEEVSYAIQVDRASIWLLSEDKAVLRCISLFENQSKKHSSGSILRYEDYPRYFDAIKHDKRINSEDAQNDPRTNEFTKGYLDLIGITSMLDAGIYMEGELHGVVCLEHIGEKRIWYSDEEAFASTIASIVSQTLADNNRKLMEEALRLSEEKYRNDFMFQRSILESPTDIIIFALDQNYCYTAFTKFHKETIKKIWGADIRIGMSILDVISNPDDRQKAKANFDKALRGEYFVLVEEYGDVNLHRTIYEDFYSSIKNSDDVIVGVSVFVIDITERKLSEEVIKEALLKAEAGSRLKTAFMNNISHEIRTPLNGILGFTALITDPEISVEEKEQFHSLIKTSSSRLLSTVINYMDISLMASGTMDVKCKSIDLHKILRQLYDQFWPLCSSKNLELHLEIPGRTADLPLFTDAELLQKIISHLLDNAVKFTIQGEIRFGYFAHPGVFEFYVKDTGVGISPESQSLIFESFVQEELTFNKGHEGSGLGLSIAQGLVKLLGGEMRVDSAKRSGSTFFFTLPHDQINNEVLIPKTKISDARVIGNPVVLVAEDYEPNLQFIRAIFKRYPITLLSAANGLEAVVQCHEHPEISLVLMDIKMPVMDGLEATREIRSFMKGVPIIATTAYGMTGDEKKALEAGCDDYIPKPFEKKVLLDKLQLYGIEL
jgi:PAS domain S-box-containing protein